jgi:hypothetical protein
VQSDGNECPVLAHIAGLTVGRVSPCCLLSVLNYELL